MLFLVNRYRPPLKKKIAFNEKWKTVRIEDSITKIDDTGLKIPESEIKESGKYPVVTQDVQCLYSGHTDMDNPISDVPLVVFGDHSCVVKYIETPFFRGADGTVLLKPKPDFIPKYYFYAVEYIVKKCIDNTKYERHNKYLQSLYIPIPDKATQLLMVNELDVIEESVNRSNASIGKLQTQMEDILSTLKADRMSLEKVAPFVTNTLKISEISIETYITTDNMLQNRMGVLPFNGVANISSITQCQKGDILISNIRPYLKKIWYADKDGGCSKDVLVLRSTDESKYHSKYIYYMLCRDAFFDYVMEGKKGLKMPRGNKDDIQKYQIPMPSITEQKRIVALIDDLQTQIAKHQSVIDNAAEKKSKILEKYL